jgi:Fic family protein
MRADSFSSTRAGRVIRAPQGYFAFVPADLPPTLTYSPSLLRAVASAERAAGQLSGLGGLLPNPYLLIRPFIAREAVLSSRIEGTRASLSDLFLFEATPTERPEAADVREVANYVRALDHALSPKRKLPVSLRLVRELHGILMEGVRGNQATPGEFRRSQNWIGPSGCTLNDAIYVPPPVPEMTEALDALERFLHRPSELPPLVFLAVVHYQFEAIHPFLDGNGRIGRLLVSTFLCEMGLLPSPLLYLSAYFERRREEYYERLLRVSQAGEWEQWVAYFLAGVASQADHAAARAARLRALRDDFLRRLGRTRSASALKLLDRLLATPIVTVPGAARMLDLSYQGAQHVIERLGRAGILRSMAGRHWPKAYIAREVIQIFGNDPESESS